MDMEKARFAIKYFVEEVREYDDLPQIIKDEVDAVILLVKTGLIDEDEPLAIWAVALNGGEERRQGNKNVGGITRVKSKEREV